MKSRSLFLVVACSLLASVVPTAAITCSFKNPLIPFGQDPSVVYHDGFYYLVQSGASGLTITKADTITGLGRAEAVLVFVPPPGQPYSYDLWAPELAYLRGNWYIYVAATESPGRNASHRMYVLQADMPDPQGSWTMLGKVYDPETDKWAIDGAAFEYNDRLFFVWSGWPGDVGDFPQNTYIAEMSDPATLSSARVLISEPDQPWERSVAAIQEGQQSFIREGKLSIVYAADASWTQAYKLGLLSLTGDDPLDANSWTKTGPVLEGNPDGGVFGLGHSSSPIPSPDGSESWLLYHAKTVPTDGWDDRAIRAQKFTWDADGRPRFDPPTPISGADALPAGEACGLIPSSNAITEDEYTLGEMFVDTGVTLVNTLGSFSVAARVQLAKVDTDAAILSQDGGINSNFALGYTDGTFTFSLYEAMGGGRTSAVASLTPEAGVWYHLVGVRDAVNGQLLLYVDGKLAGAAAFEAGWDARGSFIIGAARERTQRVAPFSGVIDSIVLYNGALDETEVTGVYAALPSNE